MQTILGSGGAIANHLAGEIKKYSSEIRLVSRHPKKVNETDEIFPADLTNKELVNKAVEGSEVVYLTPGLPYNIKIWKRDWPVIMENVIEACVQNNTRLVFFDNIYAYSPGEVSHMTENSTKTPATRKGKVRLNLLNIIFDAIKDKGLQALVARSADFYGKDVKTGFLNIGVIDKLKKGNKAMWQSDAGKIHSFTYVPDAARAVAILGNTLDAFNQEWHLPTSTQKWTGKDFINKVAKQLNVKPRYYILNKTMISLLGIFSPTIKELKEMQYQNDRDYFFDSSKFDTHFSFIPTTYEEGIKESLK
ncbi:MAG TPA: NAD-dependent epimerase/dehydratase family protein [Hanamia sp.]|nr:NAD-dependent epimerase/dehydratase family protein [Hanamia sp.]